MANSAYEDVLEVELSDGSKHTFTLEVNPALAKRAFDDLANRQIGLAKSRASRKAIEGETPEQIAKRQIDELNSLEDQFKTGEIVIQKASAVGKKRTLYTDTIDVLRKSHRFIRTTERAVHELLLIKSPEDIGKLNMEQLYIEFSCKGMDISKSSTMQLTDVRGEIIPVALWWVVYKQAASPALIEAVQSGTAQPHEADDHQEAPPPDNPEDVNSDDDPDGDNLKDLSDPREGQV